MGALRRVGEEVSGWRRWRGEVESRPKERAGAALSSLSLRVACVRVREVRRRRGRVVVGNFIVALVGGGWWLESEYTYVSE